VREAIETRLASLGGGDRLAWTEADAAAGEWFAAQAAALGLRVERDAAGNRWACPDAPPPWWGVGSHLDTVATGGAFDGALGVACGFAIAEASSLPVAVLAFADEEGARFNTPTFGSRALAGTLDLAVLDRVDADGMVLREALAGAGVDPGGLPGAPAALARLRGFLEIHIDQRGDLEGPVAIVSALAGRMRVAVEITGVADHAGATPRAARHDALAAAAQLILAAEDASASVTATRLLVEPNALSTIAARVRLWLDARAEAIGTVDAWRERLNDLAARVAEARRVEITLRTESRSPQTAFSEAVAAALGDAPRVTCFAGHDAGILAARLPTGMVLVRNPTGISHNPAEWVDLDDAAIAAEVVLRALEQLA
jgi:N-carbamoyl-L-amino-acid hydrolase